MEPFENVPAEELRYQDLKKELARIGLSGKGKKEELIDRLSQARGQTPGRPASQRFTSPNRMKSPPRRMTSPPKPRPAPPSRGPTTRRKSSVVTSSQAQPVRFKQTRSPAKDGAQRPTSPAGMATVVVKQETTTTTTLVQEEVVATPPTQPPARGLSGLAQLMSAAKIPLPQDLLPQDLPSPQQLVQKTRNLFSRLPRQQSLSRQLRKLTRPGVMDWRWALLVLALAVGAGYVLGQWTTSPEYREALRDRVYAVPSSTLHGLQDSGAFVSRQAARSWSAATHLGWQAAALPGRAGRGLYHGASAAGAGLHNAFSGVYRSFAQIIESAKGGRVSEDEPVSESAESEETQPSSCNSNLSVEQLQELQPVGKGWLGLKKSLGEVWAGRGKPGNKNGATAVLMACESDHACKTAAGAVAQSVPRGCGDCVLKLPKVDSPLSRLRSLFPSQGKDGGDAADEELRQKLAIFLVRCPTGVVVVEDAQELSEPTLNVISQALSGTGHFEKDGKQVSTNKATYVFTARIPDAMQKDNEAAFTAAAKEALTARLQSKAGLDPTEVESAAQHPITKAAQAFIKNIAHFVPLRG